jgi:hypothetical protein
VNSSSWINGIGALGMLAVLGVHAPVLLGVIIFLYVNLIAMPPSSAHFTMMRNTGQMPRRCSSGY